LKDTRTRPLLVSEETSPVGTADAMQECQPSLRDYSTHGWITQDFILGYFQSSLRDWFRLL
jgi:hypothetical protein